MPATADPVLAIEAAYAPHASLSDWMRGIASALHPVMGQGFGVLAYRVDWRTEERFSEVTTVQAAQDPLDLSVRYLDRPFFEKLYRRAPLLGWARDSAYAIAPPSGFLTREGFLEIMSRDYGYDDVIALTARERGGFPIQFAVPGRRFPVEPGEWHMWVQIGGHIELGLRLRSAKDFDAVVDPSGRVLHAEGEARAPEALEGLTEAARRAETARGRLRRVDPARAVEMWTAVVQGQWTLVERFDSDGRRFLLAQRNEVPATGLHQLDARERQVVGWISRGHSNKRIAHELGISESTVSVTLRSCLRKLGLRHRLELVGRTLGEASSEA